MLPERPCVKGSVPKVVLSGDDGAQWGASLKRIVEPQPTIILFSLLLTH